MKHKCIMCNSEELEAFNAKPTPFLEYRMFKHQKFNDEYLYHCKNCGLYWSSFRPNDEEMERYYNNYMCKDYLEERELFEKGFTKCREEYDLQKETVIKLRKDFMRSIINKNIKFDKIFKILDFGGSRGEYILEEFINAEKYVYDIDTADTISSVKKISKNELIPEGYDFIQCCHILEHVSDPSDIINECLALLKPNGYLYLEVPFEDFFEDIIYKLKQCFLIHEHINFFRTSSFEKFFNKKQMLILQNKEATQSGGFMQTKAIGCLIKKVKTNYFIKIINNIIKLKNNFTDNCQKIKICAQKNIRRLFAIYLILKG